MTFAQYELENYGYEVKTTFWEDFSIADRFGVNAIKDTCKRALEGWKNNYEFLTELVMVLNHKLWFHYEKGNEQLARVYDQLWRDTNEYCLNHLKGDKLSYFLRILD